MYNTLAHFPRILVTERRIAKQAFEHNHSDAPDVHSMVIGSFSENFRRNVIRCAYFGKLALSY